MSQLSNSDFGRLLDALRASVTALAGVTNVPDAIASSKNDRHVPLDLQSVERFEDGVVQLHYRVPKPS